LIGFASLYPSYGLPELSQIVIPGRATWREPGIHFSALMLHDGFRARALRAPE